MNAVWEKFCADLLEIGKVLEDEIVPQDPLTQAEGVRYLSRLLRYGTINCVEYTDPRWPQPPSGALSPWWPSIFRIAAACSSPASRRRWTR